MKKILLSCVTCLLAIGLVTACNNDEEVENNESTTQDTGTGGGSDTGSGSGGGTGTGGGTTEATSLSNYTLSFTLTGEEIPDYATLYITGDWNDWGFEALEVGEGVYTYTFDTITVDWHDFKLVMWYTDETVSWDGDNYVEVVNEPWIDENGQTQYGNAYFEVIASQGDDYTLNLEYEVSATLEEKIVSVTGVSISEGSSVVVAPEETVQLHAVVTPSNATDPSVTWAVKEEEGDTEPTDPVVSVDQTGLVTAGASMGTATVVVTTTDGGYTAETEVNVVSTESIIENYTLTITLGEGVTIPEYAGLYLLYNGAYTLLEFSEGTATASLGSVVIGTTLTYSVYLDYSEEYRAMEGCPEVTDDNIALSETHTIAEGETGVSGEITTIPSLVDPDELASEITVYFYLYQDDDCTIPEELPTYLYAYIGWTQDENWGTKVDPTISGTGKLSLVEGEGCYSYTFKDTEALSLGIVYYTMYFELTSATEMSWSHKVEGLTFTVPYFTATGNPVEVDVVVGDLESQILDPEDPTNVCTYIIGFKNTDSNSGTYDVSSWCLYGGEAGLDWTTSGTLTQDTESTYGCDYYYSGSGHKGENISIALYPATPSGNDGWDCRLCGASGEINPADYSEEPYWISGVGSSDSKLNCGDATWMAEANLVCMIIEFDFSQFSSSSYALVTNVTVTHSTVSTDAGN